jgi:hypothetical protein
MSFSAVKGCKGIIPFYGVVTSITLELVLVAVFIRMKN